MESRPANTGLTPKCFKTSYELIKFTISFIALVVITRQICTYLPQILHGGPGYDIFIRYWLYLFYFVSELSYTFSTEPFSL